MAISEESKTVQPENKWCRNCNDPLKAGTAAHTIGICVWCVNEANQRSQNKIRRPRYGTSFEPPDF